MLSLVEFFNSLPFIYCLPCIVSLTCISWLSSQYLMIVSPVLTDFLPCVTDCLPCVTDCLPCVTDCLPYVGCLLPLCYWLSPMYWLIFPNILQAGVSVCRRQVWGHQDRHLRRRRPADYLGHQGITWWRKFTFRFTFKNCVCEFIWPHQVDVMDRALHSESKGQGFETHRVL